MMIGAYGGFVMYCGFFYAFCGVVGVVGEIYVWSMEYGVRSTVSRYIVGRRELAIHTY